MRDNLLDGGRQQADLAIAFEPNHQDEASVSRSAWSNAAAWSRRATGWH